MHKKTDLSLLNQVWTPLLISSLISLFTQTEKKIILWNELTNSKNNILKTYSGRVNDGISTLDTYLFSEAYISCENDYTCKQDELIIEYIIMSYVQVVFINGCDYINVLWCSYTKS